MSHLNAFVFISKIRKHLGETLPYYMIPSLFSVVNALPLTSTGKIDRKKLASIRQADQKQLKIHVSPETSIEKLLSSIWTEVLEVEHVGIHDNFFDVGGHSLLLIRISSLIHKFLNDNMSPIVMIEGLEYLITQNDFTIIFI